MERFIAWLKKDNYLWLDVILTAVFSLLGILFAWQYGFVNSPDAFYRGVLGKSIAEGHPYFTNLKQGWLHEYGPWHHDAAHEPLLPLIFALFFLVFGNKIIIANLASTLSATIIIFPLLRLSRRFFNTPWLAFFAYILLVFNKDVAYLFEVLSGLSLPVSLLAIISFILFLWKMLESDDRRWRWAAAFALASFYLIRSDAQLLFFGLMITTLFIGSRMLTTENVIKLKGMWLISFIMILPWYLRKLVLFGNPFFNHVTPIIWADRGYDYFTYHESVPLPTPHTYFANHSIFDFIYKISIAGPGNVYSNFQRAVSGPLWLYLFLFMASLIFISRQKMDNNKNFIFYTLWLFFAGFLAVFSLVPVLDTRYFIPLYFIIIFTILSALYLVKEKEQRLTGRFWNNFVFYLILVAVVLLLHKDFLFNFNRDYLRFSYFRQDQAMDSDLLISGLKAKNISKQAVILGPFADVQRLAFATGLTFIEEPDNLMRLADPAKFFRKYNIRYSLVDVSQLLPADLIAKKEIIGDKILFTIRQSDEAMASEEEQLQASRLNEDQDSRASILAGLKGRQVYIDNYHGNEIEDYPSLRSLGLRLSVGNDKFTVERQKLLGAGLLLINYGSGKSELLPEEEAVVKEFIANGGRILLLCPAWGWVAYEKKGLERLVFNKIAENFDLILTADYVTEPFTVTDKRFQVPGIEKEMNGVFSSILYEKAEPLLVGSQSKAAAVSAIKGQAKIIVWAHDNLLRKAFLEKPAGKEFAQRLINWLLL